MLRDTKKLTYVAVLIVLSFIGSLIKVQGSIAFDSMPAFFGALFMGPVYGAIVGALGHLLTSFTSGFPLSLPLHILIAVEMGVFTYVFGILYKKNRAIGIAVLILLNSVVGAFLAALVAQMFGMELAGKAMFAALIVPLVLASAANAVLASAIYEVIKKRM